MIRETVPVFRNEGRAKVTGSATYADDYIFKNCLHAVPVYSDRVHAEITSLNTSEAMKASGVVRVFSWKDVPGDLTCGQIEADIPLLVKERIRANGDVLALVVAETRAEALSAAKLVTWEANDLTGIFSIPEALAPGAPLIYPDKPGNIVCHHKIRQGDAGKAIQNAEIVVEHKFSTPTVEHAYIEPEAAVAVPNPDGTLEIYGSFQQVFNTRHFISRHLNISYSQITVNYHPVGGAFGGKDDTANFVGARVALAAQALGRPVKMVYDREWSMRESYKCPAYLLSYRMGVDRNGKIVGAEIDIYSDSGAYTSTAPWFTWRSAVQCCGPYYIENVHADVFAVVTNNPFTGAFRGFGSPQVNFAIEQMMDLLAERCGLTPEEVRRRNMVTQDGLTITRQKLDNHTVNIEKVMNEALEKSKYREKVQLSSQGRLSRADEKLYGIGFACAYRGVSYGAEGKDFSNALISVQFDGSILVETSVMENGQGAQSAMILMAAEMLGVNKDRIQYRSPSTSSLPDGCTTTASRGTLVGGGALKYASMKLKKLLSINLCDELGCSPDEINFEDDEIKGPTSSLTWKKAGELMFLNQAYPIAFGSFQAPAVTWDDATGTGTAYFSYTYGCQVAEVEVDPVKESINVLKVTAVHDVGRIINPGLLRGQVYGGIVQGLGTALTEDLKIDAGRIENLNFNRYKIPRTLDVPEMNAYFLESEDSSTPSGAKGIGEPAIEIISPAIANAVAAATGRRCYQLPIKLDKGEPQWQIMK